MSEDWMSRNIMPYLSIVAIIFTIIVAIIGIHNCMHNRKKDKFLLYTDIFEILNNPRMKIDLYKKLIRRKYFYHKYLGTELSNKLLEFIHFPNTVSEYIIKVKKEIQFIDINLLPINEYNMYKSNINDLVDDDSSTEDIATETDVLDILNTEIFKKFYIKYKQRINDLNHFIKFIMNPEDCIDFILKRFYNEDLVKQINEIKNLLRKKNRRMYLYIDATEKYRFIKI